MERWYNSIIKQEGVYIMSKSKELELLHEKHFVFTDGQVSIKYYDMEKKRLSLSELSEIFSGSNEFFPNIHNRISDTNRFEIVFYEPGGYEEYTFAQYIELINSPNMNRILFDNNRISSPVKAMVRSTDEKTNLSLCLDVTERKADEVAVEWFVASETEATASMLRYLISLAYQNGMIRKLRIKKQ